MMKKITLLLFLITASFGFSQDLPITFEDANDSNIIASLIDGGTFTIVDDVDNLPNGKVGQFDGEPGGALYDHIYVPLTTPLDIAVTNTITFRIKQIGVSGSTDHLFKLQPGGGTGANRELSFTTTADTWETVTLNFGTATGTYNELIIFLDFNNLSTGSYLIDDIEASFVTPPTQEITVKVDLSEQAPGGVNIAWWNGSGFDEYPATDEGNGVWSYVLTSEAPANLVTGVLRTYKWHLYFSGGGDQFENMQSLPGGGGLEHDMYQALPDNEPINTDFTNYLDRGVMPDGSSWTANTYYFNSFRQPGVSYTDIVVSAPTGQNIVMDYSVNEFNVFHGPGTVDNGDGTHTAQVRSSVAFTYLWNNLSTATQEDLSGCASSPKLFVDGLTYRIHNAGEIESDDFNGCPSVLGIDELDKFQYNIFPNPTQNVWNIKTQNENIEAIRVFDILGKSVLTIEPNSTEAIIDGTQLGTGMYLARIETAIGFNTLRLIKN